MKILVNDLLNELIIVAEKAAKIARIFRNNHDNDNFKLLIQEKINVDCKNPRFQHDYKTFADVLIQEMAKYYLDSKYPGFRKQIFGEENSYFQNKLGNDISIQIDNDKNITYEMFVKILDNNKNLSQKLIEVIYSSSINNNNNNNNNNVIINGDGDDLLSIKLSNIAIWIDPIDSTSEYIKGQWNNSNPNDSTTTTLVAKGLHCVTCLFGVFDIRTGQPIIGVCNQPFYRKINDDNNNKFEGRYYWGYNINNICRNNIDIKCNQSNTNIILIGGKESIDLKNKINNFSKTMYVAGAGHKLLNVAIGNADLLLTSSKSTYYWDTCAIHAILRSLGGGIISFDILNQNYNNIDNQIDNYQIKYKEKLSTIKNIDCNHSKGLIAYRSIETLRKILKLLKN